DADLVAGLVHLALDLGGGTGERRQEGLEPGKAGPFGGEAETQELVEYVIGLVAESCDQPPPSAFPLRSTREYAGIEFEHRLESRSVPPLLQCLEDLGKCWIGTGRRFQSLEQGCRTASRCGEVEQLLLADVENRTAQKGRKRQIIGGLEDEAP